MPYKDLEKRKLYHRDYCREYMRSKGRKYRDKKRSGEVQEWKVDLLLEYKFRRIQKKYGIEGLKAFERDMFCCSVCGEWDIRVLEMHELRKPFMTASYLKTVCSNCHTRITFHSGENENAVDQDHWDSHFMRVAEYYGSHSACFSRKLGAVIVKKDEFGIPYVVSLGRNGPPIGIPHCNLRNPNGEEECPRKLMGYKSGEGLEMCPASHAEANAIMFAAREGRSTDRGILYGNFDLPCKPCAKDIIQAGIIEVVLISEAEYRLDDPTLSLLKDSGVFIRVIDEVAIKEKAFKIGQRNGMHG